MMKKTGLFLCTLVVLVSCQLKDEVERPCTDALLQLPPTISEIAIDKLPQARIGNKTSYPLEISNVRRAFEMLDVSTKVGMTAEDIAPTHHYIAFTPSNDEELGALKSIDEDEIILHYFPVDYEVSDGIISPDERFMLNGYQYVWAFVPVNYDLESIKCPYIFYYDTISLDDINTLTKSNNSYFPDAVLELLIKKAYALCGMEYVAVLQTKAGVHPSGTVKFYDTDYQTYRAVDGFKVRAVRGTHQCWMNCNSNGYFYSTDTFQNAFQYEFMFRRDNFEIVKNNESNFAVIKLSGQTGPVNVSFADDESCVMAAIDRAAITYYYGNNLGLMRPPAPSDNTIRLTIHAQMGSSQNSYETGHFYVTYYVWPINPHPFMNVFRKHSGINRPLWKIYATTIHELAHASMWLHGTDMDNTELIVRESYAVGVAWALATEEYSTLYSNEDDLYRCSYTGVVQDMIDNPSLIQKRCNKKGTFDSNGNFTPQPESNKSYLDFLSGVSIVDIETAAMSVTTWSGWKAAICSLYASMYHSYINAAFDFWDD